MIRLKRDRATILKDLDLNDLDSLDKKTRFLALAYPQRETINCLECAPVISGSKQDDDSWKQWTEKAKQDRYIERV